MSATLGTIRSKIRRLTGSPSATQLSDTTIDDYVNTFYLYDMPEHLKTLTLRTSYVFFTTPNVDVYAFPREQYSDIVPPLYIAGYQSFFSQSREQFYRVYPQLDFLENLATGNGTAGPYNLTASNTPMMRGYTWQTTVNPPPTPAPAPNPTVLNPSLVSQVYITAVDAVGNAIIARDDGNGNFVDQVGNPLVGPPLFPNFVNYTTGAIQITFGAAVPAGNQISVQYISVQPARPSGALFYGDNLFLRPIPDNVYKVQIDAYVLPTVFLNDAQRPQLSEWWQYIAYGAALKILTDRLDADGIQRVMPFFQEQQRLVLRRTIVQQTSERTSSIYADSIAFPYANDFGRF